MNPHIRWLFSMALAVSLMAVQAVAAGAAAAPQKWTLVNPEGVVEIQPMKLNPHPATLEGATVMLRWNGKHNGDKFLERLGELLKQRIEGVKVLKNWEVAPETVAISQNPGRSVEFARKLASFEPDIVIASQAD